MNGLTGSYVEAAITAAGTGDDPNQGPIPPASLRRVFMPAAYSPDPGAAIARSGGAYPFNGLKGRNCSRCARNGRQDVYDSRMRRRWPSAGWRR